MRFFDKINNSMIVDTFIKQLLNGADCEVFFTDIQVGIFQ